MDFRTGQRRRPEGCWEFERGKENSYSQSDRKYGIFIGCRGRFCIVERKGDTLRHTVFAYDFEPVSGAISNRRPFLEIDPASEGLPDGLTVDAEGFVWSALVNFGRMLRLDPTGNLERIVTFPPTRGTCCTFGGPDYGDLYITTARECLTAEQIAAQPLAGSLFRCRPGVHGLAETPFAG